MRYVCFAIALLMAVAFLVPQNADAGLFHARAGCSAAAVGCSAPAASCSGYVRVGLFQRIRARRAARAARWAAARSCSGAAVGCSGAVVAAPMGCSGR